MTEQQWNAFSEFRNEFKLQCQKWSTQCPQLQHLQASAAQAAHTPSYPFQTPVVYNTDLDKITAESNIALIVIGDNPGKDEQLTQNQRYLVGQAGKIAEGYFRRNPELKIDFRQNVIILNKTPIHSAKTNQLKTIVKEGGLGVKQLLDQTQIWMAEHTAKLQTQLGCQLWLVGYSELKPKGIFSLYRDSLQKFYTENPNEWEKVFVFQHFSMNRFSIDLNEHTDKKISLQENICKLGKLHKEEIFG